MRMHAVALMFVHRVRIGVLITASGHYRSDSPSFVISQVGIPQVGKMQVVFWK